VEGKVYEAMTNKKKENNGKERRREK